ncbi:MAG TPA: ATP-binding protein [Thermoanaerobaculia bacterium]|nr:ATP-binding protein [Thermoanaerobaculia bacterium]
MTPPVPARGLTKIGFRRDVRSFLVVLVGFLLILIVALLFVLEQFSEVAQGAVLRRWNVAADAAAELIGGAATPADVRIRALLALTRYEIASIEVTGADGQRLRLGAAEGETTMLRRTEAGLVRMTFDQSELDGIQRRFVATASVSVAAAMTGMFLLVMYLPRITKPIEEMLDQARELSDRDDQTDETTYLIATFRDSINRLKVQETELKRLHESEKTRADELEMVSATLTRSLTSGFIALDPDARVLQLNAAAREILAVPPERDAQVDIAELVGDAPLATVLREAIRSGETVSRIEVEHGSTAIGLTAVPLLGENARLLGMLALFTDLTPIRQLEARVRAMQTLAELGEIAAGIAHEFRNSLSTILGYLKLVLRNELPAEATNRLRAAESEATQLTAAVERLLTFARPMTLQVERVDLRELTDDVVERLRGTAAVQIAVGGHASIDGDRALLARAVDNVVRNAVDAVAERGDAARIAIAIADQPPSITVTDNGIGFDEADAARLLLPFVSNKPGGFGLGLSLARKVAVLHGGDIALNGTPGEGAVVRMSFASTSA